MPRTNATERFEVRASRTRKARYESAAQRRGMSLSEWARSKLDDAAELELQQDEPAAPSDADVAEALTAKGALRGSKLRERLADLKATPWSERSWTPTCLRTTCSVRGRPKPWRPA
jgi:hypothetical protein